MSVEVQQLIEVINKMQASQEAANLRFDEHLTRLRENVHEIRNDYHGVASLTQMTHEKVKDIDMTLNNRIDKTNVKLEEIEKDLNDMRPSVATLKKISDNVIKTVSGIVVLAVIWAIVKMNGGD